MVALGESRLSHVLHMDCSIELLTFRAVVADPVRKSHAHAPIYRRRTFDTTKFVISPRVHRTLRVEPEQPTDLKARTSFCGSFSLRAFRPQQSGQQLNRVGTWIYELYHHVECISGQHGPLL